MPVIRAYAVALVLLAGCGGGGPRGGAGATRAPSAASQPTISAGRVVVRFAGAPPLTVEVARTPEQRRVGLMGRSSVPEGTGMLFLYARPVRTSFWMKNTLVPLSIAYVHDGRVVSTAEMTPCREDPCPGYPPAGEFTIAVEARAGFFPEHGVKPGTRVEIEGDVGAAQ